MDSIRKLLANTLIKAHRYEKSIIGKAELADSYRMLSLEGSLLKNQNDNPFEFSMPELHSIRLKAESRTARSKSSD